MSEEQAENVPKCEPQMTEEEKFKSKFGNVKPKNTDVMKRRMRGGVKYFDSGDYNMAKCTGKKPILNNPLLDVGKVIPTPEKIPHRKASVPMQEHPVTQTIPSHPHHSHNVQVEN